MSALRQLHGKKYAAVSVLGVTDSKAPNSKRPSSREISKLKLQLPLFGFMELTVGHHPIPDAATKAGDYSVLIRRGENLSSAENTPHKIEKALAAPPVGVDY